MTSDLLVAGLVQRLGAGGRAVRGLRPLPGGFSSLTYRAELDGVGVVVKMAPAGREPTGNRDVLRQARLLDAVAGVAGVPVPEVVLTDAGDPPLFVMTHVDGECVEPLATTGPLPPAAAVRGRALHLARVLAALHAAHPADLGLGVEAVTSPDAEARRWSATFAAAGGSDAARLLGDRLRAAAPAPSRVAVLHGDFRLGNALCRGAVVAAVIDWEIWSVGDPRTDLAWLLMRAAPDQLHTSGHAPGMPSAAELRVAYEAASGEPVADLAWFAALARYKYAAIVSDLARRRSTADRGAALAVRTAAIPALLADVDRLLEGNRC